MPKFNHSVYFQSSLDVAVLLAPCWHERREFRRRDHVAAVVTARASRAVRRPRRRRAPWVRARSSQLLVLLARQGELDVRLLRLLVVMLVHVARAAHHHEEGEHHGHEDVHGDAHHADVVAHLVADHARDAVLTAVGVKRRDALHVVRGEARLRVVLGEGLVRVRVRVKVRVVLGEGLREL